MDQEYQKLVAIIVDVLGVSESEITPDTTFTDDLGADSLDVGGIRCDGRSGCGCHCHHSGTGA